MYSCEAKDQVICLNVSTIDLKKKKKGKRRERSCGVFAFWRLLSSAGVSVLLLSSSLILSLSIPPCLHSSPFLISVTSVFSFFFSFKKEIKTVLWFYPLSSETCLSHPLVSHPTSLHTLLFFVSLFSVTFVFRLEKKEIKTESLMMFPASKLIDLEGKQKGK